MAQRSPTIEGFRVAFRRPGLVLAEISWRWTFGAATVALLALSFVEFLDTLPVTKEDLFLLRSRQPFLVSQAIGHIMNGSAPRLVYSSLILGSALGFFWMVAAAMGRTAVVRPLLAYFADPADNAAETVSPESRRMPGIGRRLRSVFGLSFLRVALALAAVLALTASGVIAGFVSSDTNPRPGLVFLIFLPLMLLVALVWCSLNWFLSLAPIFAISDQRDTFGSISAVMDFCRKRPGPVAWTGTVFGLLHLVVFVAATSVVAFPLAFAGTLPAAIIIGAIVLLTLIYFAVVDFFYTARLAAYVYIFQTPDAPAAALVTAPPALLGPAVAVPSAPCLTASRWAPADDDILSDVPGV